MDIHVSEWSWKFVLECLRRFQGEGIFFLLFGMAFLILLIFYKGKWKKGFVLYIGFLAVTVFNPFVVVPIVDIIGVEDEYYRLIWLLPVTILIAWMAVYVSEKAKKGLLRWFIYACFAVALAFPGKSILAKGLEQAENLYKIPQEVVEICEIMHEDSGEESIKAAFDFDLIVLMGQYDPSIEMVVAYSDVSYFQSQLGTDYVDRFPPYMLSQMHIHQSIYNKVEIEGKELFGALSYTDTKYVVVKRDFPNMQYLQEQGLSLLAETESYYLLKFEG